jgi:hypothetical protein
MSLQRRKHRKKLENRCGEFQKKSLEPNSIFLLFTADSNLSHVSTYGLCEDGQRCAIGQT